MSIVKYTTKYTLIGALAIIICVGIGGFVYTKYLKRDVHWQPGVYKTSHIREHGEVGVVRVDGSKPPPPGENGNVWEKVEVDVKRPKQKDSHTHIDDDIHHQHLVGPGPPVRKLPRDLQKRLDKVKSDGNNYHSNPNYFQEVYEAVSNGQDMETTIKLLKEYGIYTSVVLEHMDSYEAFKYILREAPTDITGFGVSGGDDKKYAKRVIAEDPRSSEALEAGLYIARVTEDPHEKETYLRDVLKYHPNSGKALYELGILLILDKPIEAIPHLKKGEFHDPGAVNSKLGVAYERLGDYKSAWLHYKKALKHNPNDYCILNLGAIARGEPILLPIQREVPAGPTFEGASVVERSSGSVPSSESDSYIDIFPFREVDEEVSPSSPEVPSPPDPSVMDSEHAAFLEFLREQERAAQEAQAAYFKRVNDFIEMAESLEKNAPVTTNDFLEKELERHLLGKQTSVAPDRLIRGFEMMNKYGREEGLKRLEKHDPKLAEQVKRLLNTKQMPPSNTRDRNTRD